MRTLISATLFLIVLGIVPMAFAAPAVTPAYDDYDAIEKGGVSNYSAAEEINDPLEPFNRAVFGFNKYLDFLLIRPVTSAYTTVFPQFIQTGVTSFLTNLGEPVVMLNTALQGDWEGFNTTFKRFAFNTTWGIGGLYDFAGNRGVRPIQADFGQTLGKWGLDHGFYLVLPLFGSSSLRDGTGRVVDTVTDPYNIYFTLNDPEWPLYARAGLAVVDARARFGEDYDNIMKNATDPYTTFRSIYVQRRAYMVQHKNLAPYIAQDKK